MSLLDWLLRASLSLVMLIPVAWLVSALLRRLVAARLAYATWLLPLLALVPQSWVSPANVVLPDMQIGSDLVSGWPAQSAPSLTGPASWWVALWVIGLLAALIRLVWVQHRTRQWIGGRVLDRLERTSRGLDHWPGWLPVVASDTAPGPLLLGSLPPRLVVPANEECLHPWILAHERAHCRHGDPLWNLLSAVMGAIFWFHPLVHLARWRIRRDQELAADEAVTIGLSNQERRAYGQLLLNQSVNPAAGLSLSWKSTHPIKERIMTTLKTAPGRQRRFTAWGLLGAGLALGILMVAQAEMGGPTTPSAGSENEPGQPPAVARTPPRYPRQAALEGVEGSVTLEADVREDGSVHSVRVVASEPPGVFDQVAVEAFSQWRFEAAKDGRHEIGSGLAARDLTVRQTIEFRLDED